MKEIISAGHICLDITPVFPNTGKQMSISELLIPGCLVETEGAAIHLGGSVGNTGLALKRLGANVRLLGKTGDDSFGKLVQTLVAQEGGTGILVDPGATTSYTIVLAIPGIDRIFLHNPGANASFSASDIPEDIGDAALFHFGYPTLMKRMYEQDGAEMTALFRRIRSQGCATSLDLAAVDPAGPAGKVDWKAILVRTLPEVDFFVPSFDELCFMLDPQKAAAFAGGDKTPDLEKDALPLAMQALSLGCGAVLLKCGTAGMVLVSAGKERIAEIGAKLELDTESWTDRRILQPCYRAETVKSATGAGDVSIAAFLMSLLEGRKPEKAVQLAAAEGACAVTTYDALSGIQPLDALEAKINAGWTA